MKFYLLALSLSSFLMIHRAHAELIELESLTMSSYKSPPNTTQDYNPQPTFLATEGGYEIRMVNSWKRLRLKDSAGNDLTANVGPSTVLSFDVKFGTGTGIPEFAAIGLDSDDVLDNGKSFLLHVGDHLSVMSGNANYPQGVVDPSWYYEIEEGWFRYSIPVGEELAAYTYNSLALISNDDGSTGNGKNGYVQFRNVRIYENEGAPSFSSVYVGEDVWVDGNIILGGDIVDHFGNPLLSGGVDGLSVSGDLLLNYAMFTSGEKVSVRDDNYGDWAYGFSSGWGNTSEGNGSRHFFGTGNSAELPTELESGWIYSDIFAAGVGNSVELTNTGQWNYSSSALGDNNQMRKAYSSIFIGYGNSVPEDVTTEFGWGYALGGGNQVANSGLAMGWSNELRGRLAQTLGVGLYADSFNCTYVGNFNAINELDPPSSTISRAEDPVFVVGNGTSDVSRNDALTVLRNGDVIISKAQGDISMGVFGSNSN